MRILHLVEPDAPGVSPMLPLMVEAAQLLHGDDAEQVVHTPADHGVAWWSLRGLLRATPVDLIHAWSERAMVVAAMASPHTRILATLTAPPTIRTPTAMLLRRANLTLMVPSEHLRRQWLDRGISPEHVQAVPLMTAGTPLFFDRTEIRMSWGVTDEAASVVLVTGPAPTAQDAMLAMLSAGLAAETGRPIRLLISPRARGLHRARRMATASRREISLVVHEAADAPWLVRDGIDLTLAIDDGPGVTWAMLVGLPIAGQTSPALTEQLRHGENALLGRAASPGEIARCLCKLHDDRTLRERLAATAKNEAERTQIAAREVMQGLGIRT